MQCSGCPTPRALRRRRPVRYSLTHTPARRLRLSCHHTRLHTWELLEGATESARQWHSRQWHSRTPRPRARTPRHCGSSHLRCEPPSADIQLQTCWLRILSVQLRPALGPTGRDHVYCVITQNGATAAPRANVECTQRTRAARHSCVNRCCASTLMRDLHSDADGQRSGAGICGIIRDGQRSSTRCAPPRHVLAARLPHAIFCTPTPAPLPARVCAARAASCLAQRASRREHGCACGCRSFRGSAHALDHGAVAAAGVATRMAP